MKDALATLGTILEKDEGRDAVHVAVIAAINGEASTLNPGDHCGFKDGKALPMQ